MKSLRVFFITVLILCMATMAWATANTCTSKTATVAGSDPTFTVTYTSTSGSQGVIVLVKYTKGTETGITLTFDKLNPSIHATDLYRQATLSGTSLSALTTTMTATGNYRIPIPKLAGETKVVVTVVFGSAAQAGVAVVNLVEP